MTELTVDQSQPTRENKDVASGFSAAPWPLIRRILEVVGWLALAGLIYVGVSSIFARGIFLLDAFSQTNPEASMNAFDIRYYQSAVTTVMHLIPGLFIAFLGPLQFIPTIRKRWLRFHRISGAVFILSGVIGSVSGIIIGVFDPFLGVSGAGFNESMATAFFSVYILFCLAMAVFRIRKRMIAEHREWMIRSFSIMMGIATERLLIGVVQTFNPEVEFGVLFGTTFWMAIMINLAVAESWINLTRTPGNGVRHWKDVDAAYWRSR